MAPNVGVQIGDDKVSNCLFVDDLTKMKINVTKTEYIVFHKDYIPDINIYYRNTLIRRTEMVKYLGLYFDDRPKPRT